MGMPTHSVAPDSGDAPTDNQPMGLPEPTGTPMEDSAPEPVSEPVAPPAMPAVAASSDSHDDVMDHSSLGASADLLSIKKEAMEHLSPLVGHLEQSPEEKFKTTMMMIQASDDQSLVPKAYEAAKAITDDKARAQALLDIINEINYFTQADNDKQ